MRGCVTAVLLSFLLVGHEVSAQCNYSGTFSYPFRTLYLDIAANDYEVWAATGYGIQLFGRGGAQPATLVQSIALPGVTRVVRRGFYVYAGSGTAIWALDNPQASADLHTYRIDIKGSVDAGATVNDIAVTPNYMYVATSNGLQQYDLLNPAAPSRMATLPTSSSNVISLSLSGSNLYAADGDNTVEIFDVSNPTLPQRTGSLQSLPRSTGVHATATRVYVTDGQNTDVFIRSGTTATKVGTAPFGTTAFAPWTGDVVFAAGADRRVRGIDWTNAGAPVEIFATDVIPSGGTINRATAMQISGSAFYVAAGDAGLQAWDLADFKAPFAVRSYATGAASSVMWAGGKMYAALTAGGIAEFSKSSSGALTAARQWDARIHTLQDANDTFTFLLSSTGSLLTYWFLGSTTPTLASSAQFKSTIAQAVLVGSTAYVVLADRTLWSADLSQQSPLPQSIATGDISPSAIARSGSALAIADLRDDATTAVSYFSSNDFTKAPQTISVPGIATIGVTLSGTTAAVFTFRGINVIDFASGTTFVLPQSNSDLPRGMAIKGSQLLELTDTSLRVWDLAARGFVREFSLPAGGSALAVDVDQVAGIATPSGVTAVAFDSTSAAPRLIGTRGGNAYYKKVAASGDRLYLFDGRSVDIFSTATGAAPHFLNSVRPPGIVDFAVASDAIFAVSNAKVVTAYTLDGVATSQATLAEGSDVQLLSIATAAGAPWIAFSKCISGTCQQLTAVLDPRSLVRTALLDGAAKDVATSAARAYAIFDLPAEIRVYDQADPLHPSLLASRAAEGSTALVSVAQAGGTVYVLGEKLYAYSASDLTKSGEQLTSFQTDQSGTYTYVDQRVRIDGTCGLVSGRSASPQLFGVPAWSATSTPAVPASVRSVAAVPGRFYLLTDNSLEVWTTQGAPAVPRRRATK